MNYHEHESEIITIINNQVELTGKCSIQKAAEEAGYESMPASEQKEIAKLLSKTQFYVTEKKGNEIFVMKNEFYRDPELNTKRLYKTLKYLAGLIIIAIIYLVFHFLLPTLTQNAQPASPAEKYNQLPETIEVSRDKDNFKSFSVADTLYINYKIKDNKEKSNPPEEKKQKEN